MTINTTKTTDARMDGSMRKGRPFASLLCTGLLCAAGAARSEEPAAAAAPEESARGHGSISIGFQDTYVDGQRLDDSTVLDSGKGRDRSAQFDIDYFVADRWSLHAGIVYVSNTANGYPHCPTTLPPQCRNIPPLNPSHPESHFLDDGAYHGTWQDWSLGAAYHADVAGDYLLTPSLTLYAPSHDYTFFSAAAPGQRIWKLDAGLELAHQFRLSNWFYRASYGYVYTERVLDTRLNYHRLDLELGYFFNEAWAVRVFSSGKKGQGYTLGELAPLTDHRTNDYWYHHDQIVVHDYADVGAALDHRFADKYTFSIALHKLIWGLSVANFKYSAEARLTREF